MSGLSVGWRCDWCGGELETFAQSESGMRCIRCWRTEGNDNVPFSVKNQAKRLAEADRKT